MWDCLTRLITCSLSYSTTRQDKVNKPLGPTSESADYLFTKLQYYMQYCSLVNMESAESDVGLSGLFTLSWNVVL
jgi:hypothetical protein